MKKEELTKEWHNEILEYLIEKRNRNPNFKFWLRQRDRNDRLTNGYWFQGNDDYVFCGFYLQGGYTNMTQSIGFVTVVHDEEQISNYLEIVYADEKNNNLIKFYEDLLQELGPPQEVGRLKYIIPYKTKDVYDNLEFFFSSQKPIIDTLIQKHGLQSIFEIPDAQFLRSFNRVMDLRKKLYGEADEVSNYIMLNLTWSSNDWKSPSEDPSNHAWVKEGGVPHESWNFDFNNPRNNETQVKGFSQRRLAPKITGNNNLVVFHSKGQIVGFYGKAEILPNDIVVNQHESYNLIADKSLSLVLNNKIQEIKEKGYLEGKQRMGQINYVYLKKPETIKAILDEAKSLNPEQASEIQKIEDWVFRPDETNYWVFQGMTDSGFRLIDALKANSVKTWRINQNVSKIKKGDKIILRIGGEYQGIYGLGHIISNVETMDEDPAEISFYDSPDGITSSLRVKIDLHHNLINNPIGKDEITRLGIPGGRQGTNFLATKEQYEALLEIIKKRKMAEHPLNQILFGPPGTGKTFSTINEAVKIVAPEYYQIHELDREKLKEKFKDLLITDEESREGQIAFCTFHQSFSYEDFVEGIKPLKPKDGDPFLKYDVVPGIFRKLCQLSEDFAKSQQLKTKRLISWDAKTYSQASFYKISLGDSTLAEDNEIFEYCIKNNCIAMGFGNGQDFSGLDEAGVKNKCNSLGLVGYDPQALNLFINYIKVDNYVVVSNGLKYCRAIGKVTGKYRYEANSPIRYNNFRDVEWIFINENIPVSELYNKNFSQQTIYKLDSQEIKKEFFVPEGQLVEDEVKDKNFVLIIDEINRGNVSAIFGELITLIEPDKRDGADEELRITLPYSKKEFKVPANVYIIGTMNTADRSIEALDTALRRRFSFIEKPPIPSLIQEAGASKGTNGIVDGIDLVQLLEKINLRIEKLIDKDHKIGHAYFMGVRSLHQLKEAFHNKVIPLLEEYFFGDFGKIGLVLGESFIDSDEDSTFNFASFPKYDLSIQQDLKTRKVFKMKHHDHWDFVSVYK